MYIYNIKGSVSLFNIR